LIQWLAAASSVSFGTLTLSALESRLGLANDGFGLLVLFRVVARFVPEMMAVIEADLCGGDVDLFGTDGGVGKNGDSLGQDFNEATADAVGLLAGLAAVKAHFAGAKDGDERGMPVEDLKIAVTRRNLDRIRGLIDEDAIGGDEPDLQAIRICHGYLYAVAFIFSAASSTSSMVPFM
jgi:hypothetical protein